MIKTGIIRRVDDLGRVVIPKEIRRMMRIKEGDPLEIFTTENGVIILKSVKPNKMQEIEVLDYFNSLGEEDKKKLIKTLMNNL